MITLTIATYNRVDFLFESFSKIISNDLISEICIVDDFSDIDIYNRISNKIDKNKKIDSNYSKIKLYRNQSNLGSFLNKLESVKKSTNDWVILLDSDNIIDTDYLDIIKDLNDPNTIYAPSHAVCDSPYLNYSKYSGTVLDKIEYKKSIKINQDWAVILNTGNYFVNRNNYLKCVYAENIIEDSAASDAYYLVYLWFKNIQNAKFEVVSNLKYFHRLHSGSHYVNSRGSYDFLENIRSRVNLWT